MIEDVLYLNELLDLYEDLLTKKQASIAHDYYREDLSLQEIADNHEISKAAVYDALKKTQKLLHDYEAKLSIHKLFSELKQLNNQSVLDILENYQKEDTNENFIN